MCSGMNCPYEEYGGDNWGECAKPSMQGKPGSSCYEPEEDGNSDE